MAGPFPTPSFRVPGLLDDEALQQQLKQYTKQQNDAAAQGPPPAALGMADTIQRNYIDRPLDRALKLTSALAPAPLGPAMRAVGALASAGGGRGQQQQQLDPQQQAIDVRSDILSNNGIGGAVGRTLMGPLATILSDASPLVRWNRLTPEEAQSDADQRAEAAKNAENAVKADAEARQRLRHMSDEEAAQLGLPIAPGGTDPQTDEEQAERRAKFDAERVRQAEEATAEAEKVAATPELQAQLPWWLNAAREATRGLERIPTGTMRTLAIVNEARYGFKGGRSDARAWVDTLDAAFDKMLPADKARAKDFSTQLAAGGGSMLGFLALGAIGGMAGVGARTSAAIIGAATNASQAFEDAEDYNASALAKYLTLLMGAGIGATEALPIDRMLLRAHNATGGLVTRMLHNTTASSLEEFLQEFGQNVGNDLVAKWIYDENRNVDWRAALEQGVIGGITGGLAGAATSALAESGVLPEVSAARQPTKPAEQEETTPQDDTATDRAQEAFLKRFFAQSQATLDRMKQEAEFSEQLTTVPAETAERVPSEAVEAETPETVTPDQIVERLQREGPRPITQVAEDYAAALPRPQLFEPSTERGAGGTMPRTTADGNIILRHQSGRVLEELDPDMMGTGPLWGPERDRLVGPNAVGRTYYGVESGPDLQQPAVPLAEYVKLTPEEIKAARKLGLDKRRVEQALERRWFEERDAGSGYMGEGLGPYTHEVVVGRDDLYNMNEDPLNLRAQLPDDMTGPERHTLYEKLIKDAGFRGAYMPRGRAGFGRTAILFTKEVPSRVVDDRYGLPVSEIATPEDFRNPTPETFRKGGWAVVTGTQEALGPSTSDENIKANNRLRERLRRDGVRFEEISGTYKGVPQGTSFLIFAPERYALQLGKLFKQESILTRDGLVYSDGSDRLVPARGTVIGDEALNSDFYSTLPDGTAFSVDLDFDAEGDRNEILRAMAAPTTPITPEQAIEQVELTPDDLKPLPGLKTGKPVESVVRAARAYAASVGLPVRRQSEYVKVDVERAKRIAEAYENMKDDPTNPEVAAAYDAMIEETLAQYQFVKATGLKIEAIEEGQADPYPEGPKQVLEDLERGHLWFFPTDQGFGSLTEAQQANPLLRPTDEFIGERRLLANDVFRIVHDFFGHGIEGSGFGARGEENAWQSHMRLYSQKALPAVTSETRGQNSWVNYGPYGEQNRANQRETIYADQKAGIMPSWTWTEGVAEDMPISSPLGQRNIPATETPAFKRWFGDSKVVDDQGKPLVVYHHGSFDETDDTPSGAMHFGTEQAARERAFGKRMDEAAMAVSAYEGEDGNWHWDSGDGLTSEELGLPGYSSEDAAILYGRAEVIRQMEDGGLDGVDIGDLGNTTAVYLSIKNPKRMADLGGANGEWDAAIEQAKAQGFDGIVYRNQYEDKGSDSWIAFDAAQIKSVNNRGTFDPNDERIMYQRAPVRSAPLPLFDAAAASRAKPDGVVSDTDGVVVSKVGDSLFAEVDGVRVGELALSWRGAYATSVEVNSAYRRRGIATKLYDAAEAVIGRVMIPSPMGMSDDAVRFWKRRLSKFGAAEKQSMLQEALDIGVSAGISKSARDRVDELGYREPVKSVSPTNPDIYAQQTGGGTAAARGRLRGEQTRPRRGIAGATSEANDEISLSKIAQNVIDLMNLTARQGRFTLKGSNVVGQYSARQNVVRMKTWNDLSTLVHEGAHALEQAASPALRQWINSNKVDLAKVAQSLYGGDVSKMPPRDVLSEGFAEFFRVYTLNRGFTTQRWPTLTQSFRDLLAQQDPRLAAGLDAIGDQFGAWLQLPSAQLVRNMIVTGRQTTGINAAVQELQQKGFGNWYHEVVTRTIAETTNRFANLNNLVAEILNLGEANQGQAIDLKRAEDPRVLIRLAANVGNRAMVQATGGVMPYRDVNPSTQGLRAALLRYHGLGEDEHLAQIDPNREQDFAAYLVALRGIDEYRRLAEGKIDRPPLNATLGDLRITVKEMNDRYGSDFAEAAKIVHEYGMALWKKAYDAGLMTKQTYVDGLDRQFYAPLQRDMSDKNISTSDIAEAMATGKGRSIVKRFRGSDRDIINPMDALLQKTFSLERVIIENDIKLALARLADRAGKAGALVERVPAYRLLGQEYSVQEIARQLTKDDTLTETDAQDLMTILEASIEEGNRIALFRSQQAAAAGDNVLFFWEQGKLAAIQLKDGDVGADIINTMNGIGRENIPPFLDLIASTSTAFRASITSWPDFLLVNFIRDQASAFILTDVGYKPFVTGLRGVGDEVRQNDWARQYNAAMGVMGGMNTAALHKARVERDIAALKDKGYRARVFSEGKIRGLANLVELTESGTRIGIFRSAYNRAKADGLTDYEASIEASYIATDYIDFGLNGSRMLILRRTIPFLNAQLQGFYKLMRTLGGDEVRQRKGLNFALRAYFKDINKLNLSRTEKQALQTGRKAWIKMMSLGFIGAALALAFRDDPDYQDASEYLRATGWVIPMGDGRIFYIPKPFELAVFSNLVERGIEFASGDGNALSHFLRGVAMNLSPPVSPPAIQVIVEQMANYDFFTDREIVPDYMRALAPELQYNHYTSDFAKKVGEIIGMSPLRVDHLLAGFGASAYRDLTWAYNSVLGEGRPSSDVTNWPVTRRFVRDARRGAQSAADFWSYASTVNGTLRSAETTYKTLLESGQERAAEDFLNTLDPDARAYALLNVHFKAETKRLNPFYRARQIGTIVSAFRRELSSTLGVEDTSSKFSEPVKLSADEKYKIDQLLSEYMRREMRNTLIYMQDPGWRGKTPLPTDTTLDLLEKTNAFAFDELKRRIRKANIYSAETVQEYWPEARDRLLSDREAAFLTDLTTIAKVMR